MERSAPDKNSLENDLISGNDEEHRESRHV